MRALLLSAALAGCAGPAVVVSSGADSGGGLDCALGEVTALGYVIDGAEGGVFFRAQRGQPIWFGSDTSDTEFDVLTASRSRGRLVVQASAERRTADGVQADVPSDRALEDAGAVVAACTG